MTTGEIKHIVAFLKNKPVLWSLQLDQDLSPLTLVLQTTKGHNFKVGLDLTEPHAEVSAKIYRFIAMTKDHVESSRREDHPCL